MTLQRQLTPNGRALVLAAFALAMLLVPAPAWAQGASTSSAGSWMRDILPAPLFEPGPNGLMWWQWLAFPVLAFVAWAIGRPLGMVTRGILHRLASRTKTTWDDRLFERIGAALTMLWAAAVFSVLLPWLELAAEAEDFVQRLLAGWIVFASFWALWRSVDVLNEILLERPWAVDNPSARSLMEVAGNFVKGAVALVGILSTIAALGFPVTTALAGVGIGGVALAFGAQKTIENVFGSVALATDQPFRVGDFVKIEDFVGTIERIGTRSTQIRTLDRTLISIPNGRLADMRLETFAARDRIRFTTIIGVVYETNDDQMRRILAGMEEVLRSHPKIWSDTVVVRFAGFGDSALEIEIMAWFQTTDYNEYRDCRQDVLFGFMKVVLGAGSSFAFPTRTVHLVHDTPPSVN